LLDFMHRMAKALGAGLGAQALWQRLSTPRSDAPGC
jgi:hypothetical protein